jgi:hypothetical protein
MDDQVIGVNYVYCWVEFNAVFCFRRINHMALKLFALILCLHVAVHHVTNTKGVPWYISYYSPSTVRLFITVPLPPLPRY